MIWDIKLKLKRSEDHRKEDETWFDEDHIKTEIKVWLENLDYTIEKIEIQKKD